MTSLLRSLARSTGLLATDTHEAERVLGRGHGLTHSLASQHTLALQSLIATLAVVAGAFGVLVHVAHALLVAGSAAIVGAIFVLAWVVTRETVRERAQELIEAGDQSVVIPVVARERRRLASRKERERLARSLESYVDEATRWPRIDPRSRPPREIRCLLYARGEARDVTRLVRSEAPSPRGVAALLRFLTDGERSSLFAGDLPRLRWELLRIAQLLEPGESRARRGA